jgi:hypothetical protein
MGHRFGDMLTVVGIIAVVVAISLPAFSDARRQAKAVVCAAQLRESFNAVFMYAEDHRGRLPYMGSYYKSTKFAHPKADHAWPTAIAPYVQENWEIYRCPADPEPVEVKVVGRQVEHILLTQAGPDDPMADPPVRTAWLSFRGEERRQGRLGDPRRPGDAMLLIEGLTETRSFGRPRVIDDHFHSLVRRGTGPVATRVHASLGRHDGASHFVFYDGAVKRIDINAVERVERKHRGAGLP